MNKEDLQNRITAFITRIIRMIGHMPDTPLSDVIGQSLMRAAVTVGINYNSACRADSSKEYADKLRMTEERADETLFWLELVERSNMFQPEKIKDLKAETNELLSIFGSDVKTAKSFLKSKPTPKSKK